MDLDKLREKIKKGSLNFGDMTISTEYLLCFQNNSKKEAGNIYSIGCDMGCSLWCMGGCTGSSTDD